MRRFFVNRIKLVQKKLGEWKVDGCLIENKFDLFYLTGLDLSAGSLLIFPHSYCLFIDGRYLESVKRKKSIPYALFKDLPKNIKEKNIAFDSNWTSYSRYLKLKSFRCALEPIAGLLKEIRGKKEEKELVLMKKSGKLALEGIQYLESLFKPGITENELAKAFEIFCLERGAEKLAFDPIIGFGANSALPHHRAGNSTLKKGDLVLIDVGIVLDHYCSDLTRVFFYGKEDPELKKMYRVVLAAYREALKHCRAGNKVGMLDQIAYDVIVEAGFKKQIAHSLGHGVGLEVHEFPRVNQKGEDKNILLESGMVLTIEPGLYLPGKGGVRYEDTVIIKEDGYEFAL